MKYDTNLQERVCGKTGKGLEKLLCEVLAGAHTIHDYPLHPPIKLKESAGRGHEVNAWAAHWKENKYGKVITANKRSVMNSRQSDFPVRVEFADAEAVLRYLGEGKLCNLLQEKCRKISRDFPQLAELCVKNRELILTEENMAESIWQLASYLSGNYRTDCYLRELDIPYVDTKFIERHNKLVVKVFVALHDDVKVSGWEALCDYLHWQKVPEPNIYVRSLDKHKTIGGLQEMKVTAAQLALLKVPFSKVIITENRLNGYVFPEVADGLIIFGAGNGVVANELTIPWLEKQQHLWYWGDMDREGFRILSRVREKCPQVRSFLMNRELAEKYPHFMTSDTSCLGDMPGNLTGQEQAGWEYLAGLPEQVNRLEQEKIPLSEVREFLRDLY